MQSYIKGQKRISKAKIKISDKQDQANKVTFHI